MTIRCSHPRLSGANTVSVLWSGTPLDLSVPCHSKVEKGDCLKKKIMQGIVLGARMQRRILDQECDGLTTRTIKLKCLTTEGDREQMEMESGRAEKGL